MPAALVAFLITYGLPAAGIILTAAAGWAAKKWFGYVDAKKDATTFEKVSAKLALIVEKVVGEVEQTTHADLAAAAKDGVLSDAEKAQLKNEALGKIKDYLGAGGIKEVSAAFGIPENAVTNLIISYIEHAVLSLKF